MKIFTQNSGKGRIWHNSIWILFGTGIGIAGVISDVDSLRYVGAFIIFLGIVVLASSFSKEKSRKD